MRTISFRTELGINKGFDSEKNHIHSVTITELCELLQQLQNEVENETGIYVSTVVSGPNRSVYRKEWGCPDGGEVTYTIHAVSDSRLQMKSEQWEGLDWKKAALTLAEKIRSYYEQEYLTVEFVDSYGFSSFILNPDNDILKNLKELESEEMHDIGE